MLRKKINRRIIMEKLSRLDPWITIWYEPKQTIKTILSKNPRLGLPVLAAIYGLPLSFHLLHSLSAGGTFPIWANVIFALLLCIPLGLIGISIVAAAILWVGRPLHGKGNFRSLQAVVAWSNLPAVITIITWFCLMIFLKNKIFIPPESIAFNSGLTMEEWRALFFAHLTRGIAFIWSFILLVWMNAEAQDMSIQRSFANIFISFVVLVAIGLLVHGIFNNLLVVLFKI